MSWNNIGDEEVRHHIRYSGHYSRDHYNDDDYRGHYRYHKPGKFQAACYLIRRIWRDRRLRWYLILSLLLIKVLIVLAVIVIVPLTGRLVEIVDQEGLKGIFESLNAFIGRLWNGA